MSAIVKEVYDAFRSAGVSDEQATAAAQAIPLTDELATKADLREVHAEIGELRAEIGELRAEIGELRAEIGEVRTELRAEIGEVRTELRSEVGGLRAEVRADMKDLELRMTVKLYSALALVVAGIKALDFLIG